MCATRFARNAATCTSLPPFFSNCCHDYSSFLLIKHILQFSCYTCVRLCRTSLHTGGTDDQAFLMSPTASASVFYTYSEEQQATPQQNLQEKRHSLSALMMKGWWAASVHATPPAGAQRVHVHVQPLPCHPSITQSALSHRRGWLFHVSIGHGCRCRGRLLFACRGCCSGGGRGRGRWTRAGR